MRPVRRSRVLAFIALGCLAGWFAIGVPVAAMGQVERCASSGTSPTGRVPGSASMPTFHRVRGPHPAVLVIPGGRWVEGSRRMRRGSPPIWRVWDSPRSPSTTGRRRRHRSRLRSATSRRPFASSASMRIGSGSIRRTSAPSARRRGAHLAALLDTWGEGPTDVGARIKVAVSWSGPMDLERLIDDPRADLRNAVRTFLGCSASASCRSEARAASPVEHVDESDGPLYLGNGTQEVIPLTQATVMVAELDRNGVRNQLVTTQGREHGFGAVHNDKFFTPAMTFLASGLGAGGMIGVPAPAPGQTKSGAPRPGEAPSAPGIKEGGGAVPDRDEADTPWWAIVAITLAVIAAFASLLVSIGLFRQLQRANRAQDDIDIDEHRDETRSFATRGTESPG